MIRTPAMCSPRAALLAACLSLFSLTASSLQAAGTLQISEILASNSGLSRVDADGDPSDWIEIQNVSSSTVNLAGWHLTDSPDNLTEWTFPATNLAAGQFILVFASGKNRAVPGKELHTNFQLSESGEFLALVQPDHNTIESGFIPQYPAQIQDVSYGTLTSANDLTFTDATKPARWRLAGSPADLTTPWRTAAFDDSSWSQALLPLGFDAGQITGGAGITTNIARGKTATQSSTLSTFRAGLAVDGAPDTFTHTVAGTSLPATWEVNLRTNTYIDEIILQNRQGCCGSRLRDITVLILSLDGTKTNFTSQLLNPENVLGSGGLDGPASITLSLSSITGSAVLGGRVKIVRTPDPDLSGTGGQGNADEKDVLSLGEVLVNGSVTQPTFKSILKTDIQNSMLGIRANALLRIPFLVVADEVPTLDQFLLRMRYDDGFIAYLNGIQIAQANAPTTPAWNSSATAERPDSDAIRFQEFNLLSQASLLQDGINILAIQALNKSETDDDFLIQAELTGRTVPLQNSRYFINPTPAAPNQEGTAGFVQDTRFSVDRGFYSSPFQLEITTTTPGAEIRYTTNGTAPDILNGLRYTGPIPISRSTVIRAFATKPGYTPSNVDTHTYLFLDQVVARSQKSVTDAGYPSTWAGVAADYGMDPRIFTNVNWAPQMQDSLQSLPTVCFSSSISNFFDSTRGFYANPTSHGVDWERPVSMEMLGTDGSTEFQEDCGLRVQGGYFRDPNVTQKHSLRVLFKAQYGKGKLRHNLFPSEDAVAEFDTLVLRAGANDGYAWGDAKDTEQFIRNRFGGELHQAMGHAAPHGKFVHVYFNGVYWGIYELLERPNEDFSASYYGGDSLNWDSVNAGDVKNGDLSAWDKFSTLNATAKTLADYQKLQGNNPDGTRNPNYPVYLDKNNYIDYMIANMWGGNWDWPNKNFWFGRDRTTNSTGFKFYMWDFENTMGNNRDRSPISMVSPRPDIANSWVGQPHYYLKNLPEYRMDFADRVQKHFFNGGVLTPAALVARYQTIANHVELSILAETARWGDDNLNPPQDIDDWRRERDWILGTYLPQRSDVVLKQFISGKLVAPLAAPRLSQYGGTIPPGFNLQITQTNAGGQIYFTVNGADPRLPGGALSPTAQLYSGPLPLQGNTFLRTRVKQDTNWSAIIEANFTTQDAFASLAITEIMYNPSSNPPANGEDYEFLELQNTGTTTLDLTEVSFSAGVSFQFTNGTRMLPGQFLVLVKNPSAFQQRYPTTTVDGVYSGSLANGGETITLSHPTLGVIASVTYRDNLPWPQTPDGYGFSLVARSPESHTDPDQPTSWRASTQPGGSPGLQDPIPPIPAIVINEILSRGGSTPDFIELHNPTSQPADVSGWFLTDDPAQPAKWVIPPGSSIPAGGYQVFQESQFNPPNSNSAFSLNADGDSLYLFSASNNGALSGYSHGFEFGAAAPGVSFGRVLLSNGQEDLAPQLNNTPGQPNAGPAIGPVVITEIHYHPPGTEPAFIEIQNISSLPQPLFDTTHPTNTWRIRGAGFQFPPNISLAPGEIIIVTDVTPELFRSSYPVSDSLRILSPFTGSLQNSGERIELQRPDLPGTNKLDYISIDAVRYNDRGGWPRSADGSGPSLQRKQSGLYGNDPAHWTAARPTAGNTWPGGTIPSITSQPQSTVGLVGGQSRFQVIAAGGEPLTYQWRYNQNPIAGANKPTLELAGLTPDSAGRYSVVVFGDGGAVTSSNAVLSILQSATIALPPQNAVGILGSNVTFSITAFSSSPITYQWKFNGSEIPGATAPTLTLRGLTFNQSGLYSCLVRDSVGVIESKAALLTVVIKASLTQGPLNTEVVTGKTAIFSATADGTPPLTFRWRRNNATFTNLTVNSQICFLIIPNAQPGVAGTFTVSVTNLAGASTTSPGATLAVLSDSDGDGMPNEWEIPRQFNPTNPADASLDFDGDGMSNLEEYLAGTDPRNPNSLLQWDRISRQNSLITLEFSSKSNRTYSIQVSPNLTPNTWSNLFLLPARSQDRIERISSPFTPETNQFYRVVTPAVP